MHPRVLGSPTPSAASRLSDRSDGSRPIRKPSVTDFEIERPLKMKINGAQKRPSPRRKKSEYGAESALRTCVARLLAAKARPFTVTGRILMDPASLVLFFRSKVSGS